MAHGDFGWHELTTTDVEGALAFYGAVIGWTAEPAGPHYTQLLAGGSPVCGVAGGEGKPAWTGYVIVDDVDACVARCDALGGAVLVAPADMAGVMRHAAIADPHGARLVVFDPVPPANPWTAPAPETTGVFSFNELMAGDCEADFAFYSALFGWTRTRTTDLEKLGPYVVFANHGRDIGGMMTKRREMPRAYWGFYFQVDGVAAAVERIRAGGGTLLMPPHQVPGGTWVCPAFDPQGAVFAVMSDKA